MQNENKNEGCACAGATILVLLLIACMLFGCRTKYITQTEYKEVPVNVHDTLIQKFFSHDTTIVRDSVLIQQKGDTVFYTKYKDIYKTKWLHDTTTKVVEKPVNVYQTTEKIIPEIVYQQKWWQKTLMWIGILSLVVMLFYIGIRKCKL